MNEIPEEVVQAAARAMASSYAGYECDAWTTTDEEAARAAVETVAPLIVRMVRASTFAPIDLDQLAVEQLARAPHLVDAVLGHNPDAVAAVLEPMTVLQLRAMCVVLATCVPVGSIDVPVLSELWSPR